jgi:GNAT superfamily N-acetyltransferase
MSETILIRTDSSNPDFQALVKLLNAELTVYNGNDNDFYMQFNKTENIRHVVVAYDDKTPVGCGTIKEFSPDTAEVKRMYVSNDARGKGIGKKVLAELEEWARELKYKYIVMETGKFLSAAVNLYKNSGYEIIPNYEPYTEIEKSVCFRKIIKN